MPFLSDRSRVALSRLGGDDRADAGVNPLDRLRGIRDLIAALESDPATLMAVRDALDGGAGWPEIADASGVKPAAAKWRWQGSDDEIAARHEAGRRRSDRPSSVRADLPGLSVSDAARALGVTPQAIYLRVSRGRLQSRTVVIADGRTYKRVFLDGTDLDGTGLDGTSLDATGLDAEYG